MITIVSYKSVGPIAFGMKPKDIYSALGTPRLSTKDRYGDTVHRYDNIFVTTNNDGVVEVELLPDAAPNILDIDILSNRHSLYLLSKIDANPYECSGAIILLNIGISITGMHDDLDYQKSVTAFARGRFDELKKDMVPYVYAK